jgi:hypothetical protein
MPYYRAVRGEVSKTTKQVIGSTKTVWEGTDLKELEKKFPRIYFTNGNNLDDLRIFDGPDSMTITLYLVRETEAEVWQIMPDDPRSIILREPGQRSGGRGFTRDRKGDAGGRRN